MANSSMRTRLLIRYPLTTEKAKSIKAKLDQLRDEQTAAANGGTNTHLIGGVSSECAGGDRDDSHAGDDDADGGTSSGGRIDPNATTTSSRYAQAPENVQENMAAAAIKS